MLSIRKVNPMLRAVGVISAVTVLATGVTFAALQSQATLTQNTIASGTAGLLVDGSDEGTTPSASEAGLAFSGVVPGGSGSTKSFSLQNSGDTKLVVSVQSTAPNWTPNSVDNTKVTVAFHCTTTAGEINGSTDLSTLISTGTTIGQIPSGETATCDATVTMAADATSAAQVTSDGFDLTFTGTAI